MKKWICLFVLLATSNACAPQSATIDTRTKPSRNQTDDEMASVYLESARALEHRGSDRPELLVTCQDLATKGLSLAPPMGHARAVTVIALLMVRASASILLKKWSEAQTDFLAAEKWATNLNSSLLATGTILAGRAELAFAQGDFKQSRSLALAASTQAVQARNTERGGSDSEWLACKALEIAANAHTRYAGQENGWVAPEYRALYSLARSFNFPPELRHTLFVNLDYIQPSEDDVRELMGPFVVFTFHDHWEHAEVDSSSPPPPSATFQPASSATSAKTTADVMTADFRECYQRGLQVEPKMEGEILLNMEVGPSGYVTSTHGRSVGVSEQVVHCISARAGSVVFAPPEGGSATIKFPLTFLRRK